MRRRRSRLAAGGPPHQAYRPHAQTMERVFAADAIQATPGAISPRVRRLCVGGGLRRSWPTHCARTGRPHRAGTLVACCQLARCGVAPGPLAQLLDEDLEFRLRQVRRGWAPLRRFNPPLSLVALEPLLVMARPSQYNPSLKLPWWQWFDRASAPHTCGRRAVSSSSCAPRNTPQPSSPSNVSRVVSTGEKSLVSCMKAPTATRMVSWCQDCPPPKSGQVNLKVFHPAHFDTGWILLL